MSGMSTIPESIRKRYADYPGRCSDSCIPVCDFCQHWNDPRGEGQAVYTTEYGWCDVHQEERVIYDQCEHFSCMNAPDKDES